MIAFFLLFFFETEKLYIHRLRRNYRTNVIHTTRNRTIWYSCGTPSACGPRSGKGQNTFQFLFAATTGGHKSQFVSLNIHSESTVQYVSGVPAIIEDFE